MSAAVVPTAVMENGLARREEFTGELQPTSAEAMAQHEIQSTIIIARRFPRDEDAAYQKLMKACQRPSFADEVTYSFPRGGTTVTGPSVYLAREFARIWGNIRHGVYIVHDDDNMRTIRAWAWDVQTNSKTESDDSFKKLVFRKNGGWIKPDERDLRELTNRRAAIALRNCILSLLPSDMIEDAIKQATETLAKKIKDDPEAARKSIITAFGKLNIPAEQIAVYLGHPIAESQPAEIAELRTIYKSILDGNSKWSEHLEAKRGVAPAADDKKPLADRLKEKAEAKKAPDAPPDIPNEAAEADRLELASTQQLAEIDELLVQTNLVTRTWRAQLKDAYGVSDVAKLTTEQASAEIQRLFQLAGEVTV